MNGRGITKQMVRTLLLSSALIAPFVVPVQAAIAAAPAPGTATVSLNIPAQDLGSALSEFARQSNQQLLYSPELARGKRSAALRGNFAPAEGLRKLLIGSGVGFSIASSGAFLLGSGTPQGNSVAVAADGQTTASSGDPVADIASNSAGISEILVVGSRSQNVDIRRTEDDPQPYVVFDSTEIKNSNATNLEGFIRSRLPMNTQSLGVDQRRSVVNDYDRNSEGQINLRGLGTNQTLILVDGRRIASNGAFALRQSSIAGISLSSIERIEVLPSTAGAIYGGNAVGGVINIILKRDYNGIDVSVDYGNTSDFSTGDYHVSLNGGFNAGNLSASFRANHSSTSGLSVWDRRNLIDRSIELADVSNPSFVFTTPPLGATTNICATANNFSCSGGPLVFDNGTPLNASVTFASDFLTSNNAALITNAGHYNRSIPRQPNGLIRGVESTDVGANIRYRFAHNLEAFLDGKYSRSGSSYDQNYVIAGALAASNPANPFQQSVRVTYVRPDIYGYARNRIQDMRLSGGLIYRLPGNWAVTLEHSYGRSRNRQEFNSVPLSPADLAIAVAEGLSGPAATLTRIDDPSGIYGPASGSISNTMLRFSGPLLKLPGGPVVISGLFERRIEKTGMFVQEIRRPNSSFGIFDPQRQRVNSGYLEARVPIVSDKNATTLLRELELQASVRQDRYVLKGKRSGTAATREGALATLAALPYTDINFRSTDYLIAVKYAPINGLSLRVSKSTGYLPPALNQINPTVLSLPANIFSFTLDPRRGNEALIGDSGGNLAIRAGGSPDLQPELTKSLSAGVILKPTSIPRLRISLDYTLIRKRGEIFDPGQQGVIDNESLFPGRIIRGPNLPGDPAGYAGPIISTDYTLANALKTRIEVLDIQADYALSLGKAGDIRLYAVATRSLSFRRQKALVDPFRNMVGFSDGPLKWRGNLGAEYVRGPVQLSWNMQYYSSYEGYGSDRFNQSFFEINQGSGTIPAQSYHDLNIRYSPNWRGTLSGLELNVGVQNLFDARPPVINSNSGGPYSTFGDPRLQRFTVGLVKRMGW